MQQVRRQTVTQSVYSVWEHAGSHRQTEKAMDGDVLLAEKMIWSTDMKIKGGQGSTASPPSVLEQKTSLTCWLTMLLETQMEGFCLHYQSRLYLFSHLRLCDKQIVAITLWVWEGNCVFSPRSG